MAEIVILTFPNTHVFSALALGEEGNSAEASEAVKPQKVPLPRTGAVTIPNTAAVTHAGHIMRSLSLPTNRIFHDSPEVLETIHKHDSIFTTALTTHTA